MSAEQSKPKGPDFTRGVAPDDIPDGGMIGGHVGDDAVLIARRGDEFFAIGATCTHYSGPLAEGLMVGDTVRCPWHHACFSLRTGEAIGAPAFNPVSCWRVERRGGQIFVRGRTTSKSGQGRRPRRAAGKPERIVIVGGGARGFAAAEMLRREGFAGALTMLSADATRPTTGRIARRTTLPAPRRKTGCRCGRRNSTRTRRSTSASAPRSKAIDARPRHVTLGER